MMSLADLASILRLAAERGCRVLITGDHEQLAAIEGGGGMMMLTRRMGFVQLAEPVRFSHEWERDAALRLRIGDASVLAEYDQHGRLRGGGPEEAAELACRGWLADHLAGLDSLLVARTGEQARELSRRIRDDLIHYGLVTTDFGVGLRHGAVAGRGDLIVARKNNRRVLAGAPGRWLTNRDVLQVRSRSGRSAGAGPGAAARCGEASEGPLSGRRVFGRPALREVSLDACRAMTGIDLARDAGDSFRAGRLESLMETFLWLAGWSALPPVDRHGHAGLEDCPERDAPCGCDAAGRCLRGECPACCRVVCVHGFGEELPAAAIEG